VLRESAFPVYAAGVTHRGPYKDGPGEINVPIAIDGMVIEPGDLVVGDGDGVLAIPFDAVESIYQATTRKHQGELKDLEAIANGTYDRSWVDARLRKLGLDLG
jgi:regulator of RNase E activity RraA